jgi:hypothetical protein
LRRARETIKQAKPAHGEELAKIDTDESTFKFICNTNAPFLRGLRTSRIHSLHLPVKIRVSSVAAAAAFSCHSYYKRFVSTQPAQISEFHFVSFVSFCSINP